VVSVTLKQNPASNSNKTFGRFLNGIFEDFDAVAIPLNSASVVPGAVQTTY